MAVICPVCGAQYDHTLFAFGRRIICDCGATVGLDLPSRDRLKPDGDEQTAPELDDTAERIARAADRVVALILNPAVEEYEIELEIALAREIANQLMPERIELFDLIYGARFLRLRRQFRDCRTTDYLG